MTSYFKTKSNILGLIVCLVILCPLVVGCSGPTFQGWSGFAASDNVLYFGGIDGRVYTINPTSRSQNLSFPGQNEWVFDIPSVGVPGSICGPACSPASPRVNIYATPVVFGDIVCVATYISNTSGNMGKLVAINRLAPGYSEGEPEPAKGEWMYPSSLKSIGAIVGSPIVVDKTLYVGSSDGKLYAVDTAVYGKKKWEFDTGAKTKIWTSPVVEGGVVYVSNYDRKLFAVSSADGKEIWRSPLPANIASSPAVSDDSIFVGAFDNHLYCIDRATGKERWNFPGGNWFWSTPVVKDGVVYAGCLDNKIYALDAGSGKELWQFVADGPIVSEPAMTGDLIVLASKVGDIYILDASKGSLVKSVNIGSPITAPLFVEGNMVYVHAGNFSIYAIDLQTGEKVWEFSYSSTK